MHKLLHSLKLEGRISGVNSHFYLHICIDAYLFLCVFHVFCMYAKYVALTRSVQVSNVISINIARCKINYEKLSKLSISIVHLSYYLNVCKKSEANERFLTSTQYSFLRYQKFNFPKTYLACALLY